MASDNWKSVSITIRVPNPEVLLRANWTYWAVALLAAPSLIWILKDHSVWPPEQAWNGQVCADLWFGLGHSLKQWTVTMADGLGMKAPGISWLGQFFVPVGATFGSIEAGMLLSVLLAQLATLLLLLRIGRGMFPGSRLIPVAGVLLAAASQLFVGLSHQMFAEPLQALATAWTFSIALQSRDWPKFRIVIHLGAALALGLLAKATTPFYCLVPGLYCAYFLVRRSGTPGFRTEWKLWPSRILAVVFVGMAILCACWYSSHFAGVWQLVWDRSAGDVVGLGYGSQDSIFHKFILWFGWLGQSFFRPYLGWGCLFAIVTVSVLYPSLRSSPEGKRPLSPHPEAVLSAIQIALMLFLFSSNIAVDPRCIFALLPCASILFMQLCSFLPKKALVAMIALSTAQWALVNSISLGTTERLSDQSQWLQPAHYDRSQYDEIARAVQLTRSPGRYNIVAIDEPWLNANSAAFFAAKQKLKTGAESAYTSVAGGQPEIAAAIRRIEEFHTRYLITLDESHQSGTPNYATMASFQILKRMRSDTRFTQVPFESRIGVVVFRFDSGTTAIKEGTEGTANQETPFIDPRRVPDVVSRAKPQKRGYTSLGWVNGKLATQENGGREFRVKGGTLRSCLGWAFDNGSNSTPEEVWIELTHTVTGQHYYWKAARYSRPELADSFKLPSIRMAGFRCDEPGIQVPPGRYKTKIYQVVGTTTIVSDLDTYEPSPIILVE